MMEEPTSGMTDAAMGASDAATQPTSEPEREPAKQPSATRRSLEESLAALDPDTRAYVLGEVGAARSEAKNLRSRLKDAEPKLTEYNRLVEASKTDLERAREELTRWQSEAERWRTDSVSFKVQALAAAEFADPTDAVNALDTNRYLDAGGQIDEDAIRADLADLLVRKPHYRKPADATPRVPAPNHAQGSGANGKSASDPRAEFAALIQSGLRR